MVGGGRWAVGGGWWVVGGGWWVVGGGGGGGHCRHHQSGVLGYHNIPHTNYPIWPNYYISRVVGSNLVISVLK